MQLIVETESALEIEGNMSTEDVQNNKVENLDIEDLNKKCNGKKNIIEVDTTAENEGSKDDISEVEEAQSNIPMNIDNNSTELRTIDLSEIITKGNSLEATTNESQDYSGDQQTNGLGAAENEMTNGLEEDDLEDDIISICEEPFNVIPESQNSTVDLVEDSDGKSILYVEETLVDEKDKVELIEEAGEPPLTIRCHSSIEDVSDVIELIEESDESPVQCANESEQPMLNEKDDAEVRKDSEKSHLQNENETEILVQKDADDVEFIDESEKSLQNKNEIEGKIQEDNKGDVDFIKESEKSPLQCEKVKCDVEDIEEAKESPLHSEKETAMEEDNADIEIIEEPEKLPLQCENETQKEVEKSDIEAIEILEKSHVQCEKEKEILIDEEKGNMEVIEETEKPLEQCEKEIETLLDKGKDDVEVIKEIKKPNVQQEKEIIILMDEGKGDVEVTGATEISPEECEKEIQTLMDDEVMEEKAKSPVQCEEDSEALMIGTEDVAVIEESNDLVFQCETETKLQKTEEKTAIEITVDTETVTLCEKEINSPSEEPKTSEIDPIAEDITVHVEQQMKKTSSTCEDKTNEPLQVELEDKNKTIDGTKEITVDHEDRPMEKEVEDITKVTEEASTCTVVCENKPDSAMKKKDAVEVTKDIMVLPVQIENKTGPPSEKEVATDSIESMETVEETSKCESVLEAQITDVIDSPINDNVMDVEETITNIKAVDTPIELRDDMEVENVVEETESKEVAISKAKITAPVESVPVNTCIEKPIICKLSNTLDILSDDDEDDDIDLPKVDFSKVLSKPALPKQTSTEGKQCIDIEDDDDIMVIDEDSNKTKLDGPVETPTNEETAIVNTDSETGEETNDLLRDRSMQQETVPPVAEPKDTNTIENTDGTNIDKPKPAPTLLPENFLKTAKKKLADMTRDELEEFCILKIVESIVDRSSLSEIKNKLKTITQGLEEHRRKAMMLTKQNRDLQVVLKSVQEEQKKATGDMCITPLKINRSVGMQVFMEKAVPKKKGQQQNPANKPTANTQNRNINPPSGPRPQKVTAQPIPVPRLVPANSPVLKTPSTVPQVNQINTPNVKNINTPNGAIKTTSPAAKAEKRPHSKITSNMTVDLTDDEPPAKMPGGPKTSPAPPVRLVPPQNLMPPQRQAFGTTVNSPRKVYIPISGPQNQALRPGQTIMLKTVPAGMRPRGPQPQVTRMETNTVRMNRVAARHPAPLPFAMKQYQPPNWKSLPPAPDLKLSKVENGIVISWKIEDVPEDSYEEIASYQLYAYQETSQPPSTSLWKKIGDVKALPLPMACTLTQFMAGFKYYFAVRAVDIRSRLGPFSLPGSILLLSKNI